MHSVGEFGDWLCMGKAATWARNSNREISRLHKSVWFSHRLWVHDVVVVMCRMQLTPERAKSFPGYIGVEARTEGLLGFSKQASRVGRGSQASRSGLRRSLPQIALGTINLEGRHLDNQQEQISILG